MKHKLLLIGLFVLNYIFMLIYCPIMFLISAGLIGSDFLVAIVLILPLIFSLFLVFLFVSIKDWNKFLRYLMIFYIIPLIIGVLIFMIEGIIFSGGKDILVFVLASPLVVLLYGGSSFILPLGVMFFVIDLFVFKKAFKILNEN